MRGGAVCALAVHAAARAARLRARALAGQLPGRRVRRARVPAIPRRDRTGLAAAGPAIRLSRR